MNKGKFLRDFESFIKRTQLKKLECDYDEGYRDGRNDLLDDLKTWLREEPGKSTDKCDVEFYKAFCTSRDGYVSIHVVFLVNGEYCRLQSKHANWGGWGPPEIALSIHETGDHGEEEWERKDEKILKWDIGYGRKPQFYALMNINGVAFEVWMTYHSPEDIKYRINFDSRTEQKVVLDNSGYDKNVLYIVAGDLWNTVVEGGYNGGHNFDGYSDIEKCRDYARYRGFDARLRADPLGLQLEEIWTK